MKNETQQALADELERELYGDPRSRNNIPHDLLRDLFKWSKEHKIKISAIKSLEDILKNYF